MRLFHSPGEAKRAALRLGASLAFIYVSLCAFLYVQQRHFVFVPSREIEATPRDAGCAYDDVRIGPNRLHGWWLKGNGPFTLIYHHGNGGNVGANADHACRLNQYGFNVLLFDYRGYGLSEGEFPNEQRVYEDADAAWRFIVEKEIAPRSILLYGHSLGGAVAVEMAMRHPDAAGLIVESSFTSILEMAKRDRVFRYFPLALLLDQSMDSIHKLPRLKMPVLFLHGTADAIVPPEMSRTLEAVAPQPKSLVYIPGAGHEDCAAVGGAAYRNAVIQFAAGLPAASPALAAK